MLFGSKPENKDWMFIESLKMSDPARSLEIKDPDIGTDCFKCVMDIINYIYTESI